MRFILGLGYICNPDKKKYLIVVLYWMVYVLLFGNNNTLFALMYGVINQDLEIYFSYIQNIHLYSCTQWIRVLKYAYKDIIFFIFSNVAPIVPVPVTHT
jgi:hypothetical protein